MKYVADFLREMSARFTEARTRWTVTEGKSRAFTKAEQEAFDRAFEKFDEGFKEIDKLFKGWRD